MTTVAIDETVCNGNVAYINGQYAMAFAVESQPQKQFRTTRKPEIATRIIYVDPFKQPENVIPGIVAIEDRREEPYDIPIKTYSTKHMARITQSDCGFNFQGTVYHIPVPRRVDSSIYHLGQKDEIVFQSLTEGILFFFEQEDHYMRSRY